MDFALHDNNLDNAIGAVLSGEEAVRVLFDWIERHHAWEDSLVIVTADHGHYLVLDNPRLWPGDVNPEGGFRIPDSGFQIPDSGCISSLGDLESGIRNLRTIQKQAAVRPGRGPTADIFRANSHSCGSAHTLAGTAALMASAQPPSSGVTAPTTITSGGRVPSNAGMG